MMKVYKFRTLFVVCILWVPGCHGVSGCWQCSPLVQATNFLGTGYQGAYNVLYPATHCTTPETKHILPHHVQHVVQHIPRCQLAVCSDYLEEPFAVCVWGGGAVESSLSACAACLNGLLWVFPFCWFLVCLLVSTFIKKLY